MTSRPSIALRSAWLLALLLPPSVLHASAPFRAPDLASAQPPAADSASGKGTVYIVLGSDTSNPGIHIRTKTAPYANTTFDLFRSPTRQTARIMDPAFRERYIDSSGRPFRFTWWMQGGSLYRYAENTNVPYPSLMSLYNMRRFQMDGVQRYGDEYTYHYHTWVWSDANGDGDYNWNQTPRYRDSRDDFFRNMAEALIEEDMFPVSFRSGWHFMDNDWQADLDDWVPFSLHNAWPVDAKGTPEPVNNIYTWKDAPSDWVPFRPRSDNYQLPGGDRGWNTRSVHFRSLTESMVREMFEAADQGIDQVPCIWSHVAEATFIEDLERVFALIEKVAADYPDVVYRYDTAVEAMQAWLGAEDRTPPVLQVDTVPDGEGYRIRVASDEPLFMSRPFLAVKDIYEIHRRVEMRQTAPLVWESEQVLTPATAASWSIAATDSSGNLAKHHQDILPDDLVLDDESEGFTVTGDWRPVDYLALDGVWGNGAHVADAASAETAARWETRIPQSARYDVRIRFPLGREVPAPNALAPEIAYALFVDGAAVGEGVVRPSALNEWIHLEALDLSEGQTFAVRIAPDAQGGTGLLVADAVKVSAYRRPVELRAEPVGVDLGFRVKGRESDFTLRIRNTGYEQAAVSAVSAVNGLVSVKGSASGMVIGPHDETVFEMTMHVPGYGAHHDTVLVQTEGAGRPPLRVPVKVDGKGEFVLSDNDGPGYRESGDWRRSVAQVYGTTSRYVSISSNNRDAHAEFTLSPAQEAWHAVSFVVPAAENSALRARYHVVTDGETLLDRIVDQNAETDSWRSLGRVWAAPADTVRVRVSLPDTDQAGRVLRADAVQLEHMGAELTDVTLDEASPDYRETGDWRTSVAQAFGTSSRLTYDGDSKAVWTFRDLPPGPGELSILVPTTVNAATAARYTLIQGDAVLGQTVLDQNAGSGEWVAVGVYTLLTQAPLQVEVAFDRPSSPAGVLRTDAIRWTYGSDGAATSNESGDATLPSRTQLHPNAPNPFNPSTRIRFTIAAAQAATPVRLEVFDLLGRKVAVLVDGNLAAGTHQVEFDAGNLSSGVYLYRLQTADGVQTRSMVLLK